MDFPTGGFLTPCRAPAATRPGHRLGAPLDAVSWCFIEDWHCRLLLAGPSAAALWKGAAKDRGFTIVSRVGEPQTGADFIDEARGEGKVSEESVGKGAVLGFWDSLGS